jgi:hypothetical protein
MFKVRRKFLTIGAIAAIASSGLISSLSAQEAPVQSHPTATSSESNPSTSLQYIQQEFSARRGFGGSRGDVCLVSPAPGEPGLIWSDRPLFVWELRTPDSITIDHLLITVVNFDSRELIWSQELPPDMKSIIYAGQGLQPGQDYAVSISSRTDDNPDRYLFQITEPEQQQQITTQLQILEQQLQASGATAETIAIQKAQYLIDQGFTSDGFQVLYAVENPSAELTQTLQIFISQQCPDR